LIGTSPYAGLFSHKNAAAEVFSLSLIVSLARFSGSRDAGRKRTSLFMVGGSILAIAMAGAIGPLLGLVVGLAASFLFRAVMHPDNKFAILIACVLMLVLIAIMSIGLDAVLSIFDRSSNLTGRDVLFQLWPYFFWQKPMLGYGFGGFFTGLDDAPAMQIPFLLSTEHGYASFENAYMDILIQFGLVGGIIFVSILIKALSNSARFLKSSMSMYRVVPMNVLAYVLVSSVSAGSLLLQNFLVCVFVFWIYFGLDRVGLYRADNRRKVAPVDALRSPVLSNEL
jgi:O-antigen ligase